MALKQPGLQELKARLDEISGPSHQDHGLHVSRDLLSRYTVVQNTAAQQVVSWLEDKGISQITIDDTWIRFNATVGEVEALLSCKMSTYHRDGSSGAVYRAKQYSLPEELLSSIDYVYPVTQFLASKQSERSSVLHNVQKRSEPIISPRAGTYKDFEDSQWSPQKPKLIIVFIHRYASKLRNTEQR